MAETIVHVRPDDTIQYMLIKYARLATALLCLTVAALIAIGLQPYWSATVGGPTTTAPDAAPPSSGDDAGLYHNIIHDVAAGKNYYDAVATLHRSESYPLKPFIAVRLPTLATVWATLGDTIMPAFAQLMAIVAILLWWRRLKADTEPQQVAVRIGSIFLLATGLTHVADPSSLLLHESWAGLLMAMALALFSPKHALLALILAFCATLVRETALPLLLLLTFWLGCERRWRMAGVGVAMIAIFALVLLVHKHMVEAIPPLPGDLTSPGWSDAGGWPYYVKFVQETTILRFAPYWASAIAIPLALFGWLGCGRTFGPVTGCFHLGYALLFMLFARGDNFYWGFLVAPTLLMGLAFIPMAVKQLRLLGRS